MPEQSGVDRETAAPVERAAPTSALDFGLLGPLTARKDGVEIELGDARQRGTLAILLLRPNELVTTERLVEDLWGDPPPSTAADELRGYVAELRDALGDGVVESLPAGYTIRLGENELDVWRFESQLDESRRLVSAGDARAGALVLEQALALWRGPPLADFQLAPFAREEIRRLEDLRSAAVELAALAADAHAAAPSVPPPRPLRSDEPALEERKTVTVVFGDMVAYSDLAERLDPEALRRIMARYFELAGAEIARHGGSVEKFVGDEVVGVFGVPTVREDDALRAVRAAVGLRECVRALERELGGETRLQIRIGVNTGEVLATDPSMGQAFVTGGAVGVGKRLEQAAAPGEILLGSETHELVAHAVEATELPPLELKGKHEDVICFKLESIDPEATAIPRRLDAPLVGRKLELQRLRELYEEVASGGGTRLVVILANAGIGKSRLTRELITAVTPEATTLIGRCPPYGEGITFSPLREVFKQANRDVRVLEGASYEVFAATRLMLEELARERPVLLALDDIHWAEETFLDLIENLAARLGDSRVLLLCLARPDLSERRPDWLREAATRVKVEPLSETESRLLLEALGTPEATQARIAEAAEGNPLFLEQLAAIADEASAAAIAGSIRIVLHARLDRLDLEDRAVLERGAVVGRSFSLEAVLELTAPEEREHARARLFGLVRKGFVRPDTTVPEEGFRFDHALIRDVVYDATPKAIRADFHERTAARLAANQSPAALVGHHLEQAFLLRRALTHVDRELGARAGRLLRAAAQEAFARSDLPAAIALLERARALVAPDDPQLPSMLTELGYAQVNVGDLAGAEAALDEAVRVASTLGERAAELHARIERQFVRAFRADSAPPGENTRVANEALAELEQLGDELGVARAWWLKSSDDVRACRWRDRADALEKALAHGRRAHASLDVVKTLSGLLAQALLHGPTAVSLAIPRVEELARGAGSDRALEAAVNANLAGLLAMAGSIEAARLAFAGAAAIFEEFGLRFRAATQAFVGAQIELLADDAAQAERTLRISSNALAEFGAADSAVTHRALLAEVLCELGELAEAEAIAHTVSAGTPSDDIVCQVLWRCALTRARVRRGEAPGEAAKLAAQAIELTSRVEFPFLRTAALTAASEADLARGLRSDALRRLEEARRIMEEKENVVELARLERLIERNTAI